MILKKKKRKSCEECSVDTPEGVVVYSLRRSYRRRTIEVSISEFAEVKVCAPYYSPDKEIRNFIFEKSQWINNRINDIKKGLSSKTKQRYEQGDIFLFLGRQYSLKIEECEIKRAKIEFDGNSWNIKVSCLLSNKDRRELVKKKLIDWYKDQAREVFGGRIFHYSRIMGVEPKKIVIKGQKRIWGSCSYHVKTINLNWQIILSPMFVVDYIVVHELCHLFEPNHSKKFWGKVEEVLPDYKIRQQWLKKNTIKMLLP